MRKFFLLIVLTLGFLHPVSAAEVQKETDSIPAASAVSKAPEAAGAKQSSSVETPAAKSIKLRIVAVNPSKDKTQKVPIRIYLPKEVIPDDIIDMGTMQVGYDSEKSVYYAYQDAAELKPQETRVFEVKLEDVWKIKEEELGNVREQTNLALSRLEKTEHFPQAKVIVDSIDLKLREIGAKQNDTTISREEHIGAFRVNQLVMQQIRQDIAVLEKMLLHTGAPPSIELLKDTVFERKTDIDRVTAWKLILCIIGFLALLGVGFYVRWFLLAQSNARNSQKTVRKMPVISERVEEHAGVKGGHESEKVDVSQLMDSDKEKRKAG